MMQKLNSFQCVDEGGPKHKNSQMDKFLRVTMFWVTTHKCLNIKAYLTVYVPRRAVQTHLCKSSISGIPEGDKTAPFHKTPGSQQPLERTLFTSVMKSRRNNAG